MVFEKFVESRQRCNVVDHTKLLHTNAW